MLWVKAFHIISVICWFAALFYLPRLFVYHAMSSDKISQNRFEIMERKLYRVIATPSMVATWVFGIWTASYNWDGYATSIWFHIKITLVILLSGYHGLCGRYIKKLLINPKHKPDGFFRIFNELPVFLLVAIVILVVVKPF